jgi:hypothetical protein
MPNLIRYKSQMLEYWMTVNRDMVFIRCEVEDGYGKVMFLRFYA